MIRFFSSPYVMLIAMAFFWGGNAVAGRMAVGHIPPMALSFWRWFFAALILLPFAWRGLIHARSEIRNRWKVLIILSISSVTAYNSLLYLALKTTTAVNATLIASSMPVIIMILTWFWLHERFGRKHLLGITLSLLGVLAVITQGNPLRLATLDLHSGDLIALLAATSWAFFSVLLRKAALTMDSLTLLSIQIVIGTVGIIPFYAWEYVDVGGFEPSLRVAALVGYVAFFPSVLSYYFWVRGVTALGPALAGQFTYLIPIFAAAMAVLLVGESYQWHHALSFALISTGIWISTVWARRATTS